MKLSDLSIKRPVFAVVVSLLLVVLGVMSFLRLTLRFGYMEDPDVPKSLRLLKQAKVPGLDLDPMDTTYFASREALIAKADQGMAMWRDKLFLFMSRNATPATEFFGIPGERLVELGTKVVI